MLEFILSILVSWFKRTIHTGSFIVQGNGTILVPLSGVPRYAFAYFTDTEVVTPCNPRSDTLSYEIVNNMLRIRWDVSGVRSVKWYVIY